MISLVEITNLPLPVIPGEFFFTATPFFLDGRILGEAFFLAGAVFLAAAFFTGVFLAMEQVFNGN
jgi:hypothetical protein